MKKVLSMILCIVFITTLLPIVPFTASAADDIRWSLDSEGTLTISGSGAIENSEAWQDLKSRIKKLVIEDGITKIGESAFAGFTELESIVLPDSVTELYYNSFDNTAYYNDQSNWEYGSLYAGKHLINGKDAAKNTVARDGTITIANGAFSGNTTVRFIVLCDSLEYIGASAFEDCVTLKQIFIPENTVSIGERAFAGCTGLELCEFKGTEITTIGKNAFAGCENMEIKCESNSIMKKYADAHNIDIILTGFNWSFDVNGVFTVIGADATFAEASKWEDIKDSIKEVVVEEGVGQIGNAFAGCTALESVSLPESIVKVADGAFKDCSALKSINIPANLSTLSASMFENCTALEEITIPKGVTKIGKNAFKGCTKISEVTIPESISSIGDYAFSDCSALETVNYSKVATSATMGSYVFSNCTLLESVTIPEGVTELGDYVFNGCSKLSEINIPKGVTNIGESPFVGCTSLKTVNIESGLKTIDNVFAGLTELESVKIPNGVTTIGANAFAGYTSLKNIKIPDGVTTIGASAFSGCTSLESIEIPNTVTTIGANAFKGCSSLKNANISTAITEIPGGLFSGCTSLKTVVIPEYTTKIGAKAYEGCTSIESITIPSGVTIIGEYAFSGCTVLKMVNYPSVATTSIIDSYAFSGCSSLESITIPEGVVELSHYTFRDCTSLVEVSVPDTVTEMTCAFIDSALYNGAGDAWEDGLLYIGKYLVRAKENVVNVEIKKGITHIDYSAFKDCTALESVIIPEGVIDIGNWSFKGCSALKSVKISNSVTRIGSASFEGCKSLTDVKLGTGLKTVDNSAFAGCSALAELELPSGATTIGYSAFTGCNNLRKLTIPKSVTTIQKYAFDRFNIMVIYCDSGSFAHTFAVENGIQYRFIGDTSPLGEVVRMGACGENLICTLDSKGVLTISGSGEMDVSYIPSYTLWASYKEDIKEVIVKPGVTWIDSKYAFKDLTNMVSLSLPASLERMNYDTFEGCVSLENITIPDGLMLIGADTFKDSAYYKNPDNWENGVLYIGNHLIACNDKEITSVNVKDGTVSVAAYAFNMCEKLKEVKFPKGLKKIGNESFAGCKALCEINIPESVTILGSYAFGNTGYYNDESNWENDALYIGDILLYTRNNSATEVTIKKGTRWIADEAFMYFRDLTSLTIPNSVRIIGHSAFGQCSGLETVTIPEGVTHIGSGAFYGASKLKKVTIPKSVTVIGASAFYGKSLTIYCYNASEAHRWAETNNMSYRLIGINDDVEEEPVIIASGTCGENLTWTFDEDGKLTIKGTGESDKWGSSLDVPWNSYSEQIKEIVVEEGVTYIDDSSAFKKSWYTLERLTLPNTLIEIGRDAFHGCTWLEKITLGDGIRTIGADAFKNTGYYNNSKNWEDGVLYIGNHLICVKEDVASVTIKEGTVNIANNAFIYNKVITEIEIPDSVKRIGDSAFIYCSAIKKIILPDGLTKIDSIAFYDTAYYNDSKNWENGVLYIGEYLINARSNIEEVNIKTGTRLIADLSIAGCDKIKSIDVPQGVEIIGAQAFTDCELLENVTLPNGLLVIDKGAFSFNRILKEISIPSSVVHIGEQAFYQCHKLEKVTIPHGLTRIEDSTFNGCVALKEAHIPNSVTSIGKDAFKNCDALTIFCYSGSAAHRYAVANEIPFKIIIGGGGGGGGSSKPKPKVGLVNFSMVNEYKSDFDDVASDAWYYDSVKVAFELDLVKGAAVGKYNPTGNMTIAEAITLASRIHSIYNTGKSEFVQGDIWYQVYVDYAIANGLIKDGQFADFNKVATRTEFAEIFAKAIPEDDFNAINNIEKGRIPDVAENDAVYLLYNAGILAGSDEAHSFKPDSNIQRSEVATIVTRIVDKEKRVTFGIK